MRRITIQTLLTVLAILLAPAALVGQPSQPGVAAGSSREYGVLFHEAMLQRQRGHSDAAFDLLKHCLELRPDASEVYFFLGGYYQELAGSQPADSTFQARAFDCYEQACRLEAGNVTYMEQLAALLVQANRFTEAADLCERLYRQDRSRTDMLETLLRLYELEEDYPKAIATLERIEAADGVSERTMLAKSHHYIAAGQPERAVEVVRLMSERYPNDPNFRAVYAQTLLNNGQYDEAYAQLQTLLADAPHLLAGQQVLRSYYLFMDDEVAADSVRHAMLLNPTATDDERADLLNRMVMENIKQMGDSTAPLAIFDELLAQPKPSASVAMMKAYYMQVRQMPQDSINAALTLALRLHPGMTIARLQLVNAAWERQDWDSIISLCQQARQYSPEEMAFYYYQSMAFYMKDNHALALEAISQGINVISDTSDPQLVSDFYSLMGDLLYHQGRATEAFAAFDSCLQWKADNIGCLNNYAYYLSLRGERLDEAELMSYRTVKASPHSSTYLDTYAWVLFVQQRYAEARVYIDQALQADSVPSAEILAHAGDIYALCGDTEQALAYWEQALADNPEDKLLRRKIKRKKYLKK